MGKLSVALIIGFNFIIAVLIFSLSTKHLLMDNNIISASEGEKFNCTAVNEFNYMTDDHHMMFYYYNGKITNMHKQKVIYDEYKDFNNFVSCWSACEEECITIVDRQFTKNKLSVPFIVFSLVLLISDLIILISFIFSGRKEEKKKEVYEQIF